MYDLQNSDISYRVRTPVASGFNFTESGLCTVGVLENGSRHCKPSDGSGTNSFIGFALTNTNNFITEIRQENATVPSAGTYTVQLGGTNLTDLIDGAANTYAVRVYDVDADADLTQVAAGPASGQISVSNTGLVTFHVDEAGKAMVINYRTELTSAEAKAKYLDDHINNNSNEGYVMVGEGKGRIYTYSYDASVDWSTATATAGEDGFIESGGAGDLVGSIIKVPSGGDLTLGIEFNI
jgi:hypothetical protein